jgi:hypothetical protein
VLTLAAAVTGCAARSSAKDQDPASPTGTSSVATPTTEPAPIPAPKGKVVLTVSGKVANPNRNSTAVFDQAALDGLGHQTTTTFEPFDKRTINFGGVPLAVLLARVGMPASATKIKVHALDDYQVEYKPSDLTAAGVLLATEADGEALPIAKGGPIRIVFPPGSAVGSNKDVWIWSVDSMTIS